MTPVTTTYVFYAYISGVWTALLDRNNASDPKLTFGMPDNDPTTRIASPGEMIFKLNNSSGIYSPDGPSALAGWKKGVPFKVVFTFESKEYTKFYGTIEDIEISTDPRDHSVTITALSWLNQAQTYPIVNPDLLQDVLANEAMADILADMPIQPQGTQFDTGNSRFPTVNDTTKENTRAYNEFAKLALSETGQVYEKTDGTLVFESSDHRNGANALKTIPLSDDELDFLLDESDDYIVTESDETILLDEAESAYINETAIDLDITYGNKIINSWKTNAYPKRIDENVVQIYSSKKPIFLSPNVPFTFRDFFTNPSGGSKINARPPTQNSFVKSILHFEDTGLTDEIGKVWTSFDIAIIENIKKIGNSAAYFDGTLSYMTTPSSQDFEFGSGDFWIEYWEYRFNATNNVTTMSRNHASSFPAFQIGKTDGTNSKVYISSNGASFDIANGKTFGAVTTDTWTHYAIGRNGNNWYMFKDGVLTDSWTASGTLLTTNAVMSIGRNGANYLTAVLDEIIIEKGVCRHTAAFTPRTTPYQQEGTFAVMNTSEDFTGTDISEYLTMTVDYGTEGLTPTLTHSYTAGGWVTLRTAGYGIYSDSPMEDKQEDTDSITEFGYKNDGIQQQYQQDLYTGILEGKKQVELNKQPRTDLNKVYLVANKSPFMMMAFLNVDIGDMVHIKSAAQGINGYYYVQGIEFQASGGIIRFAWIVKRAFTFENGLSDIALEFSASSTDAIVFPYNKLISGDEVHRKRSWSFWMYKTDSAASTVFHIGSDYGGILIENYSGYIGYLVKYSGSQAQWRSDTSLSLNTWYFVVVTHEIDSLGSGTPKIYVNGVLQTLVTLLSGSGTKTSEVGAPLIIGNRYSTTYPFDHPWIGKLEDLRTYKKILEPADIVGMNTEGAFGTGYYNGVVAKIAYVRTEDLTDYTDLTLTSSTKVLDGYSGYVGDPNGSPVSRIP